MSIALKPQNGFWITVSVLAIGAVGFAQAQSQAQSQTRSPFASQKKKQAWETAPTPPLGQASPPSQPVFKPTPPSAATSGTYVPPLRQTPPLGTPTQSPNFGSPNVGSVAQPSVRTSTYPVSPPVNPSLNPAGNSSPYSPQNHLQNPALAGQGQSGQGQYGYNPNQPNPYGQNQYQNNQARQQSASPHQQGPRQQSPRKQGWKDRFGFSNLATTVSGFLKLGAAATDRDSRDGDGYDADFIADGKITGEVSAVTQGGLEYGVGGEVRAQYDAFRRGFGGRVGDCPADIPGCANVLIDGTPTALRGHTSQFYTDGPSNEKDVEIALEGAYIFLRSAYGDVSVGRDDGAAYLFSLGAPTLLAVSASNSPVDYTGLDSVKTVNDASGFSEKVVYTSPRLLGDTVGVGVQFGASYALNARACGVDYCVRRNGADDSGTLSPDLDDIVELGVALDRTFDNGLSIEATGTYARGEEQSLIDAFDDLESYGLGLELGWNDWTLGGSYLNSNNGLAEGDYTAYDVGLTWKPADWGVTLGYGHSEDDNIDLESDQFLAGLSYDIGKFRLGTGVQYIERDVPLAITGIVGSQREKATSVFIEGGITF